MRMSVVRQVGGQRPLAHTHDMEMWMRIASVSDVAYIRGVDQAWHREHPASLSNAATDELGLTILAERRAAFDMLFDQPVPGQQLDPGLRAQARRTLAAEALRRAAYEYDRRRAPARSVKTLADFALAVDPMIRNEGAWQRLESRVVLGEGWLRRHPWLALRPIQRLLRDCARQHRWQRTGLYNRLPVARRDALLIPASRPAHQEIER